MRWSPLFKDCITNTDDPIQNPESPNSQSRQFSGAGTCENAVIFGWSLPVMYWV